MAQSQRGPRPPRSLISDTKSHVPHDVAITLEASLVGRVVIRAGRRADITHLAIATGPLEALPHGGTHLLAPVHPSLRPWSRF